MKLIFALALTWAFSAHAALSVYDSTCNLPKAPKHKWYFDAVNGDDINGLGTVAKPWKSVTSVFGLITAAPAIPAVPAVPATATTPVVPAKAAIPAVTVGARYNQIPYGWVDPVSHARVFKANPASPIAPGDSLELMSGNYGAIAIGVYTYGIFPSDFLTLEAVAGQKPVFASINISGIGKLYFSGIKVQSSGGGSLISLGAQGTAATNDLTFAQYPATDIIFDKMTISSVDSTTGWTATQWNTLPKNGFSISPFMTRCISLTNSAMSNVAGGFLVGGERTVIANNTLNYFRDDGLDFYGSWLNINHNRLTNSLSTSAIHKDFMQGQIGRRYPGTTVNHYHDISIDSNVMIGKTEAANTMYTYTQGIDTFDEEWYNLSATNNTIIESSCYGISFSSVHGGEIANNIMMYDNLQVVPGCSRLGAGAAGSSHEGTPTDHVHMHHNIGQTFTIDLSSSNTWDNNIATGNDAQYTPITAGVVNWGYVPGPTDTNKMDRQFSLFAPTAYRFTMTAPAGSLSATIGAGPALCAGNTVCTADVGYTHVAPPTVVSLVPPAVTPPVVAPAAGSATVKNPSVSDLISK